MRNFYLVIFIILGISIAANADEILLKNGKKLAGKITNISPKSVELFMLGDTGRFQKVIVPRSTVKKYRKKLSLAVALFDKLTRLKPSSPKNYYECALWCLKYNLKYPVVRLFSYAALADENLRGKSCAYLAELIEDVETKYHLLKVALWYDLENRRIIENLKEVEKKRKEIIIQRKKDFVDVAKYTFAANKRPYEAFALLKKMKDTDHSWKTFSSLVEKNCKCNLAQATSILANELVGKGPICTQCKGRRTVPCKKCKKKKSKRCPVCRGKRVLKRLDRVVFKKRTSGSKVRTVGREKVFVSPSCAFCGGRGTIPCGCTFFTSLTCPRCGGHGAEEFPKVKFQNPVCSTCRGQKDLLCSKCKGAGGVLCPRCRGRGEYKTGVRQDSNGINQVYKTCEVCQRRGSITCSRCNGKKVYACKTCKRQGRLFRLRGSKKKLPTLSTQELTKFTVDISGLYKPVNISLDQLQTFTTPTMPDVTKWLSSEKKIVFYQGQWLTPKDKQKRSRKKTLSKVPYLYQLKNKAMALKNKNWFQYFSKTNVDSLRGDSPIYVTSFVYGEDKSRPWFKIKQGFIRLGFMEDVNSQLVLRILVGNKLLKSHFKTRQKIDSAKVILNLYYQSPTVTWEHQEGEKLIKSGTVTMKILAAECIYNNKSIGFYKAR